MHDPKNIKCPSVYGTFSAELCTCPAQKEEWEYEYTTLLGTLMEISAFSAYLGSFHHEKIKDFIRTQLALSEERGRRATITEFVEWAKKYQIFTSTCGHTGDEEKGYQKGLTAGESLFQSELLAFADSLKSNLTQKS